MTPTTFIAQVDLSGGWTEAWANISGNLGGLAATATMIGALLVVGSIAKWVWDKRRGGGGASSTVLWTMGIGAILAAPALIVPLFLNIADTLINSAADIFS